jgi:hypothetical protein
VSSAGDTTSPRHRLECEARHWLRDGYSESSKVASLIARIGQRRGQAAASELLGEMRRQWQRRNDWLDQNGG